MTTPRKPSTPLAGGFPIALAVIAGCVIGSALGQATLGFMIGLAAGVAIALALWWTSRR